MPYQPLLEETSIAQLPPTDNHLSPLSYPHNKQSKVLPVAPFPITFGQKTSDAVARFVGSWKFIIIQSICIIFWIGHNLVCGSQGWDPYPFIFLNLLLSFQAAYTAPAIMMSQNRQSEIDRQQAAKDFKVNTQAEIEIKLLHKKIDMIKENELLTLTQAIRELSEKLGSTLERVGN